MEPVYLAKLISQRNDWLSVRQTVTARNIANADTPGFKAKDVVEFKEFVAATKLTMKATNPGHVSFGQAPGAAGANIVREAEQDVKHSGNNVKMEHELVKAGEVSRSYSLNANLLKAFNRMIAMSVR